ncbi:uncharacterized protein K444DRAFT_628091 [Hyaloscypha bicolor E]|uniref:Uncharacterized protein n=1 Tax=Hyaloscypha bicolor E TaxID=1095630 RepID=A0A2J6TGC8_9HELO|nr:uncharacterized protein K444DRAFT_628091 [Hyaloscypha bicolor E]PMD62085.1 hypothetical protein K444DRAFT_628091 [Hyaloscypha bicolor E]
MLAKTCANTSRQRLPPALWKPPTASVHSAKLPAPSLQIQKKSAHYCHHRPMKGDSETGDHALAWHQPLAANYHQAPLDTHCRTLSSGLKSFKVVGHALPGWSEPEKIDTGLMSRWGGRFGSGSVGGTAGDAFENCRILDSLVSAWRVTPDEPMFLL